MFAADAEEAPSQGQDARQRLGERPSAKFPAFRSALDHLLELSVRRAGDAIVENIVEKDEVIGREFIGVLRDNGLHAFGQKGPPEKPVNTARVIAEEMFAAFSV